MRRSALTLFAVAAVVAAAAFVFVGSASASNFGVSILKDCHTPINVGDAYSCEFEISNTVQASGLAVTVTKLTDTVFASGGNLTFNENMNSSVPGLIFSGGASCNATNCTIPFGGSITTPFISHYSAQVGDFPSLADQGGFTWSEVCNGFSGCSTRANNGITSASADINPIPTTTATSISSGGQQDVTAVAAGSSVSDSVTVTPNIANQPPPSGNVFLQFYDNLTCTGGAADSTTVPLDTNGQANNVLPEGPLPAGLYGYQAHYLGSSDGAYTASDGPCEPLRVVDANIQLTPPTATNRVGSPHQLTCHISVNDGTGLANAPAGTVCTVTILSGPGSPSAQNCTTDATGSCAVSITSAVTGFTTIQALTDVSVDNVVLHRQTGDGLPGDSPNATKRWVDAEISIAPSATNEVGHPHTFTVTLLKDIGDGSGFQPAPGETVTVTLTPSNGASPSPAGPFTGTTNAAGQFQVTFTSPTAGKVTGHASSTLSVANSAPFTVQTDGAGGDSADAVKTFVDANISITPNGTNRVGSPHTFTAHVSVNDGSRAGFVPAPDGTQISFSIDSGPGSFSTPNPCTTAGGTGSCSITLNSAQTGVTVVSAHTTLGVGGVSLTRDTNGSGGNSGPATKTWVDARISIAPSATNEVGQPHTFTVTLEKDTGNGAGFQPAAGEHVDVLLSDSNGATHTAPTGSCTNAGPNTDAAGQCTITFTSPTAGRVTGHASSTLSVGGLPVTVQTDGVGNDSADAVKTFVDANIQITPNGTNRVGQAHTFTAHVNVNDGSGAGFVNAPAGTQISFSIDSGPGSFTTPNPCSTLGTTGSCQITLTSSQTGVTVVSAHTTVSVNGVSVHRDTNGSGANSGPATKTWVNAAILIAPSATNAVGQPHTFTVTLLKDTGTGTLVPAAGEHVDVTLTNGAGATHTAPTGSCTNAGANTDAAGQCTITFTSPTTGTVTGHATATLSVGGSQPFTVQTDGVAPNGPDAVKTFVDANIQITPATATNATGTNHVLTITVNALNGTLDSGSHTATASIVSGPGSFVGGVNTCTYTGGGATASCTVTITSAVVGTTVVSATSDIPVSGVTVTRTTGTAQNTASGGSDNANKTWVDANINITPATATNPVGTNHVLTITVNALNGTIEAGPHTATASIVSGPGGFVGSPSCTYTGGGATASCTVTITSNVAGTTVVQATSDIPVSGQTITRTTGTAANTASGGSGNASKLWLAGDANIQITPANATNAVGTPHTLHCHINVSPDGSAYSNALDGTVCTVTITSGPGTPTSQNCTTSGGTGSCDVTINSATPGTSTINASTTVVVNGVSITRTTDGTDNSSGPATKNWVDGYITISPATATNPTGANHVLTITVHGYPAGTNLASGTATASILAGSVGSFVGGNTCNYTGGSDTASCTVTITSSATGTTTVRATSSISFQSATGSVTRTTGDGYIVPGSSPAVGDSADAVKHWVDANINITPATANNPIGSNHVLTITVNALGGNLDSGSHTATASIVSGPGSFVGGVNTCTYTGGAATASCTVTITSSTAGTTVVSATSNIPVGGVTITRTTGTAANTASGGSGNASKNWGDVTNVTHVRDASGNDITGTTITGGTVVHDEATVTKTASTPAAVPAPTGTVSFTLYQGSNCTGTVQATDPNKALNASGTATSATFTTPTANGSFSYLAVYSGDANYPSKTAACEPFTVVGTPPGQIAPTQTTCQQYTGGTSSALGSINYSVGNNGKISQNVNPGVFFYYAEIKPTAAGSVTVTQTNTGSPAGPLFLSQSAKLLTGSCGALSNGSPVSGAAGATFTIPAAGTYVIQIKYDAKSIAGLAAPSPANITYNFATSLGGNTGGSVNLVKQ